MVLTEEKIKEMEQTLKYHDQKWKLHKIMNFTFHLPVMHYIHDNNKQLKELEKKLDSLKPMNNLELQTLRERCDTLKYEITVERERVDTIEAVLKEVVGAGTFHKPMIKARKWLKKLTDGEPFPQPPISRDTSILEDITPLLKKEAESPEYICLKLNKTVDVITLYESLEPIVKKLRTKLYPPYARTWEDGEFAFFPTWKDLAEILLKSDGSWNKEPRLYKKYSIEKIKK